MNKYLINVAGSIKTVYPESKNGNRIEHKIPLAVFIDLRNLMIS
jgi:hypothetical protein